MALLFRVLQDHFRSGDAVEITIDGLWLRLDNGQLFVDPASARWTELVAPDSDDSAAQSSALERLAPSLAGRPATCRPTDGLAEDSGEADAVAAPNAPAGPFHATPLVAALAVFGARPQILETRLGGLDRRLEVAVPTVDIGVPPIAAAMLVDQLYAQPTVGELLDGCDDAARTERLEALAVLHALGVLAPNATPNAERGAPSLADRISQRVAERLASDPLALDPAAHRQLIADRFRRLGGEDHYTLLGLEPGADEASITAAFEHLARRVHPRHADRLGLSRDDAMLDALFGRAVEAYHTLIDADRRIAYNRDQQAAATASVDVHQRAQEKQAVAQESRARALQLLEQQEVSAAVDLLSQAARLEPNADTFALLAGALARNPGWRRRAVGAWEDAIELRPDWVEAHIAVAKVHESMDQPDRAIRSYRKVLELDPQRAEAQVALDRLGAESPSPTKRRLPWKR